MPDSCVNDESSEQFKSFLESYIYNNENGHPVFPFGTPYTYTSTKSSTDVPEIPDSVLHPFSKKKTNFNEEFL